MDDLDRLVAVDATETLAAASASGGGAAAAAGPQADAGSKNGQYRLFGMVSHLGKNTTSGASSPFPPCNPPSPQLTCHRPLRRAYHEGRPMAALQRREGAIACSCFSLPRPFPILLLTPCPPCRLPIQSSHPPSSRTCCALLSLTVMCDFVTLAFSYSYFYRRVD